MQRYARITDKIPREIVLLKGFPCIWGRCRFCDYIDDNTTDQALIERIAKQELAKVTGEFSRLAVINSGSIQELPDSVLRMIRQRIVETGITELICESYWAYRHRLERVRDFFGVKTRITIGVETFDDRLRNEVLNKNMVFDSPREVAAVTDTICLLVGFAGQTHDTVRRDIDIMLEHFTYGCVNLFTPNRKSAELIDEAIKQWFRREYAWLDDYPTVEVLWENTDFGVGQA
ncbi:MAG: radical SAM protein [Phycisphaerae bacterium]|nr:radical SAM protein [Phycisphaerae bacterium]